MQMWCGVIEAGKVGYGTCNKRVEQLNKARKEHKAPTKLVVMALEAYAPEQPSQSSRIVLLHGFNKLARSTKAPHCLLQY